MLPTRAAIKKLLFLWFALIILALMSENRSVTITCIENENHISVPEQSSDKAFLFMISSNSYFPCLSVAIHSLKRTGTQHDVLVMVTPNVWPHLSEALRDLGAIPVPIDGVPNPSSKRTRSHLRDNFTKLRAWQLSSYSKIVYNDSDFLYTRNSDLLFDLPGSVYAGRNFITSMGEWPDPNLFNAGFMVITPGVDTFCSMRRASSNFNSRTGGDQPFQNMYWADMWKEIEYKVDAVNANAFFTTPLDWDKNTIRSIHFTKATNPCHAKFKEQIEEAWAAFEENGLPLDDYNPLALWVQARDDLLETHPDFVPLFSECGFMTGWSDAGQVNPVPLPAPHTIGFL